MSCAIAGTYASPPQLMVPPEMFSVQTPDRKDDSKQCYVRHDGGPSQQAMRSSSTYPCIC